MHSARSVAALSTPYLLMTPVGQELFLLEMVNVDPRTSNVPVHLATTFRMSHHLAMQHHSGRQVPSDPEL